MKKLLTILGLVLSIGLPSSALAVTAVPWLQTNLTDTFITPAKVNGLNLGVLLNASSTLQAFTFTIATGTSATTTTFFATIGSLTSLFFTNATGTSATTTNFFATNASTTNLRANVGVIGNLTVGSCTGCSTSGVTSVSGTYPILSTGGNTPTISIAFGTTTANSWSLLNSFNLSSTTVADFGNAFFGKTATSSFNGVGALFVVGSTTLQKFTATNSTTTNSTTTIAYSTYTNVGQGTASSSIAVAEYPYGAPGNVATSTAMTLDASTANQILWPLGTSATTLTLCNFTPGRHLIVKVQNPGSGTAGAITWAVCSGQVLYWPAQGTAPTQTTTANHWDLWSFTASGTTGTSTTNMIISGAQTAF